MKQLAEDVHLLRGWPPNAINVYLVGDVLIDAATRQGERRIMRQIAGRKVASTRSPTPTPTTRARATPSASAWASRCGAGRATFQRWRRPAASRTRRRPAG